MNNLDALVIGAGVIGLTTGIKLLEAGMKVSIVTDAPPNKTTSANSGAIWGPFLSEIDSRVFQWSYRTLDVLQELSKIENTGVEMVSGLGAADFTTTTPTWIYNLEGSSDCDPLELSHPYVCGWRYRVPIIDIPIYLDYLTNRFAGLGGQLESHKLSTLTEAEGVATHVVVCAGAGARTLLGDESISPSKGQLVVVENPGLTEFFAERGDGPDLTYILPQGTKAVLGGTAEQAYSSASADSLAITGIINRCARIEPELASCRVLDYRVGFRPCRPTVRLEHAIGYRGMHLVYNYGHGGSGVSLAWACAEAVTNIISECLHR